MFFKKNYNLWFSKIPLIHRRRMRNLERDRTDDTQSGNYFSKDIVKCKYQQILMYPHSVKCHEIEIGDDCR